MNYQFEESEMPYDILNRYGLTQEMIDDLPIDVLNSIYEGGRSPVLPVRMELENGEVVEDRVRFSLERLTDGTVDVIFYPMLDKIKSEYMEAQKDKLESNKAFRGFRSEEDKQQGKESYIQYDPETRHVLSVPVSVLDRNLELIKKNYKLLPAELNALKNGKVLTILKDNAPLSIGIDLNSRTGLRWCDGNEEKWNSENKREWAKYTFGAFGCWVMSDDGDLNYVNEDDYTEEIWNEQKKQGRLATQRL